MPELPAFGLASLERATLSFSLAPCSRIRRIPIGTENDSAALAQASSLHGLSRMRAAAVASTVRALAAQAERGGRAVRLPQRPCSLPYELHLLFILFHIYLEVTIH